MHLGGAEIFNDRSRFGVGSVTALLCEPAPLDSGPQLDRKAFQLLFGADDERGNRSATGTLCE